MTQEKRQRFVIRQVPGRLAVVRLPPGSASPSWASTGALSAVVRTPDEVTVVCDETAVPAGVDSEGGWMALMLEGPLPFSMTGVLSSLLGPLAAGGVPVFVLSTFETDCILVRAEQIEQALHILEHEGHSVR